MKRSSGVGDGQAEDHGDAGVRHLVGGVQELLRQVVMGSDVEEKEDVLGSLFEVDIVPDHADEDVGADQRQPSLERLDERDRAQARPMGVAAQRDLAIVRGGDTAHP